MALLRSRALWLALVAALLLHSAVLLGGAWWHLPWRLPSQQRSSIMVQLLTPLKPPKPPSQPPVQTAAEVEAEAAAAAPQVAPPQPAARQKPAPATASVPSLIPRPAPSLPPAPTSPPAQTAAAKAVEAAEDKSQLSLLQDMQAPDSVQLQYGFSADAQASASLRWQRQDDGQYQLRWQQTLGGKSSQMQSTGVLGADGLQPLRYSEAGSAKSEVATHFVADKQQIIFSNNSPSAALAVGAQDRVSVLMQLGGILAAQYEAQALSEAIDIPVAGSSQLRMWRWQVLGLQDALPAVKKAMGEDAAAQWLAVRHDPSVDGGAAWEPTITVWYDSHGFLPVRIESRYPSGAVQDAQWRGSQDLPSRLSP